MAVAPPVETNLILPQAEALIRATGVDFRIGGDRAFYDPRHDFVQVPPPQAYFEPINWHRTALHEVGHASGHLSRLNRDLTGSFGSKKYAFEELIAEIHLRAQGTPRLINAMCDNLLLSAFAVEQRTCTVEMLDEICTDMRLEWPGSRRFRANRQSSDESFERAQF